MVNARAQGAVGKASDSSGRRQPKENDHVSSIAATPLRPVRDGSEDDATSHGVRSPFQDILEDTTKARMSDGLDLSMPQILSSVCNPKIVRSENEFKSEMAAIHKSLSNADPDAWKERADGLEDIIKLIAGGSLRRVAAASKEPPQTITNMVQIFRNLPFDKQIEDLRSTLTGTACQVVVALAFECGIYLTDMFPPTEGGQIHYNYFSPLAELWLPSLLKLSISGTKVMAQQGIQCIRQFTSFEFKGGAIPRIIPVLCEGCTDRKNHHHLKLTCTMAISNVMRNWHCAAHILERKYCSMLVKAVLSAIGDRDPVVREEARKAYWSFYSRIPQIAKSDIFSELDPAAQKNVLKAQMLADTEWAMDGEMYRLSKGYDISESRDTSKKTTAPPRPGSASGTGRQAPTPSRTRNITHTKATPKRKETQDRSKTATSEVAATTTAKPWQKPTKRTIAPPIATAAAPSTKVAPPKPQAPSSTNDANKNASIKPRVPNITRKSPDETAKVVAPAAGFDRSKVAAPVKTDTQKLFTLDLFLEALKSSDWSKREKALFALSSTLVDDEEDGTTTNDAKIDISSFLCATSAELDSFVSCLARAIQDPNLTVSMSALEACQCCISDQGELATSILFPRLHLVLPTLLNKIADFKIDSVTDILKDCLYVLQVRGRKDHMVKETIVKAFFTIAKCNPDDDPDNSLHSPKAYTYLLDLLLLSSLSREQSFESIVMSLEILDTVLSLHPKAEFEDRKNNLEQILENIFPKISNKNAAVDHILEHAKIYSHLKDVISLSTSEWAFMSREEIIRRMKDCEIKTDTVDQEEKTPIEPVNDVNLCEEELITITRKLYDDKETLVPTETVAGPILKARTPLSKLDANATRQLNTNQQKKPPIGPHTPSDPVLKYMVQPSPLPSAFKKRRPSDSNTVSRLIQQLSTGFPRQEYFVAMQQLLQLSRDETQHHLWNDHFAEIYICIIRGICPENHLVLERYGISPIEEPDDENVIIAEACHLFLQGLRVLLRYQTKRFEGYTMETVHNLLLCCKSATHRLNSNSNKGRNLVTFVIHAAERALEDLVKYLDSMACFDALNHHLGPLLLQPKESNFRESGASEMILAALRSIQLLISRLPEDLLLEPDSQLYRLLLQGLSDSSVEIRKTSVLCFVEVSFALKNDQKFETIYLRSLAGSQQRLIQYYVKNRREEQINL